MFKIKKNLIIIFKFYVILAVILKKRKVRLRKMDSKIKVDIRIKVDLEEVKKMVVVALLKTKIMVIVCHGKSG